MAKKTDISATFRLVAVFAAILLIAAAAFTYLQGTDSAPGLSELAVVSQSLPVHARAAVEGEDGAFSKLEDGLQRLAALRRDAGPAAPGEARD